MDEWTLPNLHRLARTAIDFPQYYSPADASIPSLFALFTSRLPIPLRGSQWYFAEQDRVVWPLEFKKLGFRIGFFHAGSFGAWFDRPLFESWGWDAFEDAGIVAYRYGVDPESSSRLREMIDERLVVRRVLEWVRERRSAGERFFVCYSTGLPHLPYDFRNQHEFAVHQGQELTERQSYENELAYVDAAIGELYDRLYESGFFDDGVLFVTADHGEAFAQHPGVVVHSTHIYQETTHVPLLVIHPKLAKPIMVANTGSHVDFGATLFDLLGFDWPAGGDGSSMLRAPRKPMHFLASVENGVKAGVIDGRYKYIFNQRKSSDELYDLEADPGEQHNLAGEQPELTAAYHAWVQTFVSQRLTEGRDRKKVGLDAHLTAGRQMLNFGHLDSARDHYTEALELEPRSFDALLGLGEALRRKGDCAKAVEPLQTALLQRPDSIPIRGELALALICSGAADRAVEVCRAGVAGSSGGVARSGEARPWHTSEPESASLRRTLGIALAQTGNLDEALTHLQAALALDDSDAETHEQLGQLLIRLGRNTEGREHLEAASRITGVPITSDGPSLAE